MAATYIRGCDTCAMPDRKLLHAPYPEFVTELMQTPVVANNQRFHFAHTAAKAARQFTIWLYGF